VRIPIERAMELVAEEASAKPASTRAAVPAAVPQPRGPKR
jgi:hypothetical protein